MDTMTETPAEQAYFTNQGDETAAPAPDVVAPEAALAPEVAPPAPAPEPQAPPAGHVPIGALHEARSKAKAAEQERDGLKALLARLQPQSPPSAPTPRLTVDEDPLAVLRNIHQRLEQVDQQTTEQQQIVSVLQESDRLEKEYAQVEPTYNDALDYLRGQLLAEAQIAGVPHHVAMTHIQRQAANTAAIAMQQGKNPGEVFYAFAKARGFTPKQAAAAVVSAPAVSAQSIVEQVANGRAAHKSLTGGVEPDVELGIEAMMNLNGAAFDKAWAKWERGQKRVG